MCTCDRDDLWEVVFDGYYSTYYQELLALRLSNIWHRIDSYSSPIVICTTSGLAISGWTLWSQPGLRELWSIIAGLGAVTAVLRAIFKPSKKNIVWETHMKLFRAIRLDYEQLRKSIRLCSQPLDMSETEFHRLSRMYRDEMLKTPNDVFISRKREVSTQDDLNTRIAGGINYAQEENTEGCEETKGEGSAK